MERVRDYLHRMDKVYWLIITAVSVFSLVILKSVSRATNTDYFQTQLFAVILGYGAAFVITLFDYKDIASFWHVIAGFSVLLMVYTILFGDAVTSSGGVNARAWINIAGRTFQSSELVKIAFMITYAKHISILKENNLLHRFWHVCLLGVHALVPVMLCHLQGDDGAAVVFIAMFLFMSFGGGVQKRYFLLIAGVALLALPLMWNYVLEPYQKARFTAVYNLDDPSVMMGDGWQQYQARTSIGSGQLWGKGLFNGPRVEENMVTFQHSDFIFSVVGEELGFVGCTALILLLAVLLIKTLLIAFKARDTLGTCICFGFFGLIFVQSVVNIGMCLALFPVMGVTLPFFSAGGSSAACLYFGYGLVQAVSMRRMEVEGLDLARQGRRKPALKL